MHHHLLLKILSATHRSEPYQDTIDPFSARKPSSGLSRPTTSPPVREPAQRKAPRTLALLLDRLSGCLSFSPAHTIGASVLALPHPSSDHCFSQSRYRSNAAAGNRGPPFILRFSSPVPVATLARSSNPPTAARTPRPRPRRHLSFSTTAPPSPELHFRQSSTFHESFVTTRAS